VLESFHQLSPCPRHIPGSIFVKYFHPLGHCRWNPLPYFYPGFLIPHRDLALPFPLGPRHSYCEPKDVRGLGLRFHLHLPSNPPAPWHGKSTVEDSHDWFWMMSWGLGSLRLCGYLVYHHRCHPHTTGHARLIYEDRAHPLLTYHFRPVSCRHRADLLHRHSGQNATSETYSAGLTR
jgi:hypothetical protein